MFNLLDEKRKKLRSRKIYILFLGTGTMLSRMIDFYTKESLNHVSIALDQSLNHVYSFGRNQPRNPFIGGFVKENLNSILFKKSSCAIYELKVTEYEYEQLSEKLALMEADQHLYRYNFLGLLGVMINKEYHRSNTYFCSQFVVTLLQGCGVYQSSKPAGLTRPQDLRNWIKLTLIYQGELQKYPYFDYRQENEQRSPTYKLKLSLKA